MTDEKKRRNAGFIGSALIHILIVLVISFTGLLHFSSNTEDIVEVTFSAAVAEAATELKPPL